MFLIMLFAVSAAAFAISTVSGGGAGLVLLPVLGMGLPAAQTPVALSFGSTVSSMARLSVFIRAVDWRVVRRFVPASLPGAFLGVWMLERIDPLYFRAALGLFLLANIAMLFRRARGVGGTVLRGNRITALGLSAGFVSGLTGAVGLLFNGFYLRTGLAAQQIVATRAANELLLHGAKLLLYAFFGLFTARALGAGLIIGVAAVGATLAVRRVLPHMNERLFRVLGYGAMALAGVTMTGDSLRGLADRHDISVSAQHAEPGLYVSLRGFGHLIRVEVRPVELLELACEQDVQNDGVAEVFEL